jgi:hypothetical protein
MHLQLKPVGISVRNSADFTKQQSSTVFNFTVLHAEESGYLELETGEVFRHPGRIRDKKKENISASVAIVQASDANSYNYNHMRYFAGHEDDLHALPPQIFFQVHLSPDDFQQLTTNIQSGLLPFSIWIDLPTTSPTDHHLSPMDGSQTEVE